MRFPVFFIPFHNLNQNLFATFATDMMKYMLSILICIFFIWGLGEAASEKEFPEFRTEVSEAIISQPTDHLPFFNDEASADYKISDCILSQTSCSRESNSSKTMKLRLNAALHLFNHSRTEHIEENNSIRNFNGNFIKYLCGYYVYTLKHILI